MHGDVRQTPAGISARGAVE